MWSRSIPSTCDGIPLPRSDPAHRSFHTTLLRACFSSTEGCRFFHKVFEGHHHGILYPICQRRASRKLRNLRRRSTSNRASVNKELTLKYSTDTNFQLLNEHAGLKRVFLRARDLSPIRNLSIATSKCQVLQANLRKNIERVPMISVAEKQFETDSQRTKVDLATALDGCCHQNADTWMTV